MRGTVGVFKRGARAIELHSIDFGELEEADRRFLVSEVFR
jgi:hypothetical protein